MKKEATVLRIVIFLLGIGIPSAAQERASILLGGTVGWSALEYKNGVVEVQGVRKNVALALSSARSGTEDTLDLSLSFDEADPTVFSDSTGHYGAQTGALVRASGPGMARFGNGAALFTQALTAVPGNDGASNSVTLTPTRFALGAEGNRVRDFTLEFWLYPANMGNGERVLFWNASKKNIDGRVLSQQIRAVVFRNRLQWTFSNLFYSPEGKKTLPVTVTSQTVILPKEWSHHLIRFDSSTGLLEYLVNGKTEGTAYATPTGQEGSEVYLPLVGMGGQLILGGPFTGLLDEFRVYRGFIEQARSQKYPSKGGMIVSAPLDLGYTNSEVLSVDATGTGVGGPNADGSAIQLFIQASDSITPWSDDPATWQPVIPGASLGGKIRGRWVRIAADLYPSNDGEKTPFLDSLRVYYIPDEPPPPPTGVFALPQDGAVDLSWRLPTDPDLGGFLIYYGNSPGEYFGTDAALGPSPLNVGKRTSIHVDGLRNGVVYYFSIVAYDRANPPHLGAYSREVFARPLRMAP